MLEWISMTKALNWLTFYGKHFIKNSVSDHYLFSLYNCCHSIYIFYLIFKVPKIRSFHLNFLLVLEYKDKSKCIFKTIASKPLSAKYFHILILQIYTFPNNDYYVLETRT